VIDLTAIFINVMKIPKITNEEEALAAVRQDGGAIQYVPNKLRSAEICIEAIKTLFPGHLAELSELSDEDLDNIKRLTRRGWKADELAHVYHLSENIVRETIGKI